MKRKAVKWVKELSRERVPTPKRRFLPDKRQTKLARDERREIEEEPE